MEDDRSSGSAASNAPLVDADALSTYLDQTFPESAGRLVTVERVRGGHSNETFFVTRGSDEWVLRRPPRGPLLPTAHDVAREYRMLTALTNTPVPVPRPVQLCTDTSVIGAPFYLMERVHGIVIRAKLPPAFASNEAARADLGYELIDRLADLHAVDWQAVGLGDFGKPQGYLERQI